VKSLQEEKKGSKRTLLFFPQFNSTRDEVLISLLNDFHCHIISEQEDFSAAIQQKKPEFLLIELGNQEKNNEKILERYIKESENKNIPALFLIHHEDSLNLLHKKLCQEIVDFILKPFHNIEIKNRITFSLQYHLLLTELSEKKAELEKLSELKEKFVAIVSHDLRSPFTSILGLTDVLTDMMPDPLSDEQRHIIKTIHKSAQNQLDYINKIIQQYL